MRSLAFRNGSGRFQSGCYFRAAPDAGNLSKKGVLVETLGYRLGIFWILLIQNSPRNRATTPLEIMA